MNNVQRKIRTTVAIVMGYACAPFVFLAMSLRRRPATNAPRFLVIPQLTRIGDVVCSTPVLYSLKKSFPQGRVSVLVSVMTSSLLVHNPSVDEIIVLEDYSWLGLIKKIYQSNFDWSFSLSGTSISTLICFMGCVKRRAKISRSKRPYSEVLTDWMATDEVRYDDHSYVPRVYLGLLECAGIHTDQERKEVFTFEEADQKAKQFILEQGLAPSRMLVGMSVTAGNSIKEWGDHNFLEVARTLIRKYDVSIVFIGSPRDNDRINTMMALVDTSERRSITKATTFSIEELPSLIKNFDFFVSGDTGPMHIAHALGIPLVDIIGPVCPGQLLLSGPRSVIVMPNPPVEPSIFAFHDAGSVELSRKALEQTSVESVCEAFGMLYDSLKNDRSTV